MAAYVALLRGVNVGGKRLAMADFRAVLEGLGLRDVRTYLQSGNAVFQAEDADPSALATAIHDALVRAVGLDVAVLVIPGTELCRIVSDDPLLAEPGVDDAFLHVTLLFDSEARPRVPEDSWPAAKGERAAVRGLAVYLYLPYGYGRSKLTNAWFERAFRTEATTRNRRTMLALAGMASG